MVNNTYLVGFSSSSANYYDDLKKANSGQVPLQRASEADKKAPNDSINSDYSIYTNKGISSEDREGFKTKYGFYMTNGMQLLAWGAQRARNSLNEKINSTLEENGVSLSQNENFSISVSTNGKISVSGLDDAEKKSKIEEILNNDLDSRQLFTHIDNVKGLNGVRTTSQIQYHKMYVRQLVRSCGQELEDLQLVNGEIVGANDKLRELINKAENGTDDGAKTLKVHFDRLKSFLADGLEKIPDKELTIDFQNGSLIDKDVKYGFGPEQLKSWYDDVLAGNIKFDIKA